MKVEASPVCKCRDHEQKYPTQNIDGADYQIVKCSRCGHFFTYFFSAVEVGKYYDEGDYSVRDNRSTIFHKIQVVEYKKVLDNLKEFTDRRDLLDFGSGKGVFLSVARENGYKVAGVETSKPRADYARQVMGLQIDSGFFEGGSVFNKKFSVVTMFHVLEHIEDAGVLLKALFKDNLEQGGFAVIEVPNFGSWQSAWAKGRWLHIDIPRHVSHFTEGSLQLLIRDCGLQVVKKETFSLHLGIIGMAQTILSFFGYKGFLIADIKEKKTILLIATLLVAPLAFLLEWLGSLSGKGGVLRYYLKEEKR